MEKTGVKVTEFIKCMEEGVYYPPEPIPECRLPFLVQISQLFCDSNQDRKLVHKKIRVVLQTYEMEVSNKKDDEELEFIIQAGAIFSLLGIMYMLPEDRDIALHLREWIERNIPTIMAPRYDEITEDDFVNVLIRYLLNFQLYEAWDLLKYKEKTTQKFSKIQRIVGDMISLKPSRPEERVAVCREIMDEELNQVFRILAGDKEEIIAQSKFWHQAIVAILHYSVPQMQCRTKIWELVSEINNSSFLNPLHMVAYYMLKEQFENIVFAEVPNFIHLHLFLFLRMLDFPFDPILVEHLTLFFIYSSGLTQYSLLCQPESMERLVEYMIKYKPISELHQVILFTQQENWDISCWIQDRCLRLQYRDQILFLELCNLDSSHVAINWMNDYCMNPKIDFVDQVLSLNQKNILNTFALYLQKKQKFMFLELIQCNSETVVEFVLRDFDEYTLSLKEIQIVLESLHEIEGNHAAREMCIRSLSMSV